MCGTPSMSVKASGRGFGSDGGACGAEGRGRISEADWGLGWGSRGVGSRASVSRCGRGGCRRGRCRFCVGLGRGGGLMCVRVGGERSAGVCGRRCGGLCGGPCGGPCGGGGDGGGVAIWTVISKPIQRVRPSWSAVDACGRGLGYCLTSRYPPRPLSDGRGSRRRWVSCRAAPARRSGR